MGEKYPGLRFVIETMHGSYPIGSWKFVSSRETLEEAKKHCENLGDEYRVVDSYGLVIYPISDAEGESNA